MSCGAQVVVVQVAKLCGGLTDKIGRWLKSSRARYKINDLRYIAGTGKYYPQEPRNFLIIFIGFRLGDTREVFPQTSHHRSQKMKAILHPAY